MKFKKLLLSAMSVMILLPANSVLAAKDPAATKTSPTVTQTKSDAGSQKKAAEPQITLILDDKKLNPPVPPRFVENYTFVPMRVIAEQFDAKIEWNNEKKMAVIQKQDKKITIFVGMKNVYIDGFESELEVAPIIDEGTTLVPLRFIGEQFGVEFNYDNASKTVFMFSAPIIEPPVEELDPDVDPSNPNNNDNSTNNGNKPGEEQIKTTTLTGIELNENGIIVQTNADKPKYKSFTMDNPYRLVIDVENAVLDPKLAEAAKNSEGKIASNHPLIEQIRYSQFSDNPATVRIVLDLKKGAKHYLIPQTPAGQLAFEITNYTIPAHKVVVLDGVKKYNVVLDAGHGGTDPGASSYSGRTEKEFTFPMIMKIGAILEREKHLNVLYTRTDDTKIELDDRASFANDHNAAVFVSLHANKFEKPSVSGVETYYYREDSISLASVVHDYLLKAAGLVDRGVKKNNYRVITKTTMPAVLIEAGFLSNPNDEAKLFDEAFQNKLAQAIADSIIEFTGVKEGIK